MANTKGTLKNVIVLSLCALGVGACDPLLSVVPATGIAPAELALRLQERDPPALVDLRSESEFAGGHLSSAARVEAGDVSAYTRTLDSARDVVLVCEHGRMAALTVPLVHGVGGHRVAVLAGGMQRWQAEGRPIERTSAVQPFLAKRNARSVRGFERVLAFGSGTVIKPTYMLLSLGMIVWLWRHTARDLRLMRRGLIAFLAGEIACLFGFYLSNAKSVFQPLEWLHGLGMAIGIGYGAWALFAMLDERVLGLQDPERSCALGRFCGACHKRQSVICRPQQLMRAALLLALPLAWMPWTQELRVQDAEVDLFGTWVSYRWPPGNQLFELRAYPSIAFVLLSLAWLRLTHRSVRALPALVEPPRPRVLGLLRSKTAAFCSWVGAPFADRSRQLDSLPTAGSAGLRPAPSTSLDSSTTRGLVQFDSLGGEPLVAPAPTRHTPDAAERLLFLGLGFLSFSLLRLFLNGVYFQTPYWGDIWEELTELLGMLGTLVLLWTLRERLGLRASRDVVANAGGH